MAKPQLTICPLLCLLLSLLPLSLSSPSSFLLSSCHVTRYPDLCLSSLSSFSPSTNPNSPTQLARFALTVSADRARSASSFISQLCDKNSAHSRSGGPIRDCFENMADSVDRLRQAAEELGKTGRNGEKGFRFHMSNVQTWCSAALTDENTCLDGLTRFVEPETRSEIRKKVVDVAQVTSNALALVNRASGGY